MMNFLRLALLIFLAVFFVFHEVYASEEHVIINEIMTADKNSTKNEFIELYNQGDQAVVLDKFKLMKKTSSGSESSLLSSTKFLGTIAPHGYFVISHPDYKSAVNAQLAYSSADYSIADNNSVLLYDASGIVLDKVGFGSAIDFESAVMKNPNSGVSIGRLDGKDSDDNSKDFTLQSPTPGKENKKLEEKIPDPLKTYSDKIQLTELFPNPFQAKYEEYIELYNGTSEDVDLLGWKLHDASKTGEYVFPESILIKTKKYLAIFKKDFKFALNNSGDEKVTLFDPNGKEVSSISYKGSSRNVSYNFDGSRWRWSKFLTPGQGNILNNEPYGTMKIDEDVYVNVYAQFSVSTGDSDGDNVKIVWDFGDGHKSYLANTKHKYVEIGKYAGSVKLSDGSEDVLKNFTVEVGEFPHPKIRIVSINANPEGADSGTESLVVENKSKKKINLKGWSIATGWKKFINHPIREDVKIGKGKTKELTNEISSFTLNNTKAKIQLRYPDGKVAHEIKYKKSDGIQDGEIYRKIKGGWEWVAGRKVPEAGDATVASEIETQSKPETSLEKTEEAAAEITQVKIERKNLLLAESDSQVKIELLKNQPVVLGAESVREIDGQYIFTSRNEQKHYFLIFLENLSFKVNFEINQLLNIF